MKHKKVKLSVLLLGLGLTAQAQQVTTATGGDALRVAEEPLLILWC